MRKPGIPPVPKNDEARHRFDQAIKESVEIIMGRRGQAINRLESTATLGDVVAKVNEILDLLQ